MAISENEIEQTRYKYSNIKDCLNEKGRRVWAAIEATAYGRGGVTLVCKATGISTATLYKGLRELNTQDANIGRVRKKGGGVENLIR